MEKQYREILTANLPEFVKVVDPLHLLPYLRCLSICSKEEIETRRRNDSRTAAAYKLYEHLIRKRAGWQQLITALRENEQDELVEKLERSVSQQALQLSISQPAPQSSFSQPTPQPSVPQLTPQPSVPQLTPQLSVPQLTSQPSVPQLTPQPSVPQLTPQPSVPQLTPKPSVPQLTPQSSGSQATPQSRQNLPVRPKYTLNTLWNDLDPRIYGILSKLEIRQGQNDIGDLSSILGFDIEDFEIIKNNVPKGDSVVVALFNKWVTTMSNVTLRMVMSVVEAMERMDVLYDLEKCLGVKHINVQDTRAPLAITDQMQKEMHWMNVAQVSQSDVTDHRNKPLQPIDMSAGNSVESSSATANWIHKQNVEKHKGCKSERNESPSVVTPLSENDDRLYLKQINPTSDRDVTVVKPSVKFERKENLLPNWSNLYDSNEMISHNSNKKCEKLVKSIDIDSKILNDTSGMPALQSELSSNVTTKNNLDLSDSNNSNYSSCDDNNAHEMIGKVKDADLLRSDVKGVTVTNAEDLGHTEKVVIIAETDQQTSYYSEETLSSAQIREEKFIQRRNEEMAGRVNMNKDNFTLLKYFEDENGESVTTDSVFSDDGQNVETVATSTIEANGENEADIDRECSEVVKFHIHDSNDAFKKRDNMIVAADKQQCSELLEEMSDMVDVNETCTIADSCHDVVTDSADKIKVNWESKADICDESSKIVESINAPNITEDARHTESKQISETSLLSIAGAIVSLVKIVDDGMKV